MIITSIKTTKVIDNALLDRVKRRRKKRFIYLFFDNFCDNFISYSHYVFVFSLYYFDFYVNIL